jgi:hypothetical protein
MGTSAIAAMALTSAPSSMRRHDVVVPPVGAGTTPTAPRLALTDSPAGHRHPVARRGIRR